MPGWFLVWLPLILVAADDTPSLAGAMVRLAAVVLIGYLAWAMGRGPAGPWAERLFVALSQVAWFAAVGGVLWHLGPPRALPARLGLAAGLLLGPALVTWAWRRRLALLPVDRLGLPDRPGPRFALARLSLLVIAVLLVLQRFLGLEAADLLVVGTGLGLYGLFRVQGRAPVPGELG